MAVVRCFADGTSVDVGARVVHRQDALHIEALRISNIRVLVAVLGVGAAALEWVRMEVLAAAHSLTSSRQAALWSRVPGCNWADFFARLEVHSPVVASYHCAHHELYRVALALSVLPLLALVAPSPHTSTPNYACHHTHFSGTMAL